LAKILKLQIKPKTIEHTVSGGKVTTKGEVNVTFAVSGRRNDKGYILRNVKMSVIPSPSYMFSIGKQMERVYRLPLTLMILRKLLSPQNLAIITF